MISKSNLKDRKIKIALVGCGRIANKHFSAIKKLDTFLELVGVCDTDSSILQNVSKERQAHPYINIEELIKKSNPDIITLCTPNGLHARQTIQIAQQGKHIITEKPMATRWHDALTMIRSCDDAGVKLFVVKQNRFHPTLRLLQQAIKNKRFGSIYLVNVNVFWARPQTYYDQTNWRGTQELDGGAFMNQASHYVDLLNWLIGPVQSIQAMTATLGRNIEVEDTGVLNIRWQCGAVGSMNVTMLTYPKNFEGSITILGEKGTVRIGGGSVNRIEHWEFADQQPEDDILEQVNTETLNADENGHFLYYDNVIKTLQGEAEAITDGNEGLQSLEILIAAYLSAQENRTVLLPLERSI